MSVSAVGRFSNFEDSSLDRCLFNVRSILIVQCQLLQWYVRDINLKIDFSKFEAIFQGF